MMTISMSLKFNYYILFVTQEKEKYLIQKFYVLRCCNKKVLYLCGELTHSIFFPLLLSIVWKI